MGARKFGQNSDQNSSPFAGSLHRQFERANPSRPKTYRAPIPGNVVSKDRKAGPRRFFGTARRDGLTRAQQLIMLPFKTGLPQRCQSALSSRKCQDGFRSNCAARPQDACEHAWRDFITLCCVLVILRRRVQRSQSLLNSRNPRLFGGLMLSCVAQDCAYCLSLRVAQGILFRHGRTRPCAALWVLGSIMLLPAASAVVFGHSYVMPHALGCHIQNWISTPSCLLAKPRVRLYQQSNQSSFTSA